jgi:hypothetical protein
MVSKASEDFPDPLTPVMIASLPAGSVTSMFLRLCVRAPRTISGLRAFAAGLGSAVGPFGVDAAFEEDTALEEDTVTISWGYVNRHRTTGHDRA